MRLLIHSISILLVCGSFLVSCQDEPETPALVFEGNEVLISNEGNFGWGDGSLSLYNPTAKTVQNDVFKTKNGKGLGNVFQSISYYINQYFFVLNNSNKIVVASDSFHQTNEISGLTSPRYFYRVSDDKAYVTDLYSNSISVVNLNTLSFSNEIALHGWTEKAIVHQNTFWVTNVESEYVYLVDISTDQLVDSIQVGYAPESIVVDQNNLIWVLCKGDVPSNQQAQLNAIDPINKKVVKSIFLNGLPTNLVINSELNTLYYLNTNIYTLLADTSSMPQTWKASNQNNFYSLGVNPNNGEVYVSDIHDFVQKSTIYRFAPDGSLLDEFKTGIIAGNFFFHQK